MESLQREFWKHVSTVGGPADIGDVFLKWASSKRLGYGVAQLLWKNIDREIHEAFGKKKADISVTGPKEEMAEFLFNGTPPSGEIEGEGKVEEGNTEEGEGLLEQQKKTLLDDLEGEEESPAGEMTPPGAGGSIPPLAGEGGAGAPPLGGGVGAPPMPPAGAPPLV